MKNYTISRGILPLFILLFSLTAVSFDMNAQAGCTDDLACNYDSGAVTDDGSCTYTGWYIPVTVGAGPAVQACEAPVGYIIPDQTCVESVIAIDSYCIDTSWDSICQEDYEACLGCTPQLFIPVGTNIGPVQYACTAPDGYVLADPCIADVINGDDWCVNVQWDDLCLEAYALCLGCTPEIYLPGEGAFGPAYHGCTPPGGYELAVDQDCAADVILGDSWCLETEWDDVCEEAYFICVYGCATPGCTDPTACNYDALAACDDGSCDFSFQYYWVPAVVDAGPVLLQCQQPEGYVIASQPCIEWLISIDTYCIDTSFDQICADEYFACMTGSYSGCTYPSAINYNSFAATDDGSCVFPGSDFCPADVTGDGIVNTGDLTALLSEFGNTCVIVLTGEGNN